MSLDIQSVAADIGHLGGALIVTVSVIAMGEVVRIGRYANVLLGLALAAGPWLTGGGSEVSLGYAATCTVIGLAVAALALPRSIKREQYGLWDRFVR